MKHVLCIYYNVHILHVHVDEATQCQITFNVSCHSEGTSAYSVVLKLHPEAAVVYHFNAISA